MFSNTWPWVHAQRYAVSIHTRYSTAVYTAYYSKLYRLCVRRLFVNLHPTDCPHTLGHGLTHTAMYETIQTKNQRVRTKTSINIDRLFPRAQRITTPSADRIPKPHCKVLHCTLKFCDSSLLQPENNCACKHFVRAQNHLEKLCMIRSKEKAAPRDSATAT